MGKLRALHDLANDLRGGLLFFVLLFCNNAVIRICGGIEFLNVLRMDG